MFRWRSNATTSRPRTRISAEVQAKSRTTTKRLPTKEWETAEENRASELSAAIHRIEEELRRTNNQDSPHKRRERWWNKWEVLGLWAAAAAGVLAIVVSSCDSHEQRQVMAGQLDEMRNGQRPWISIDVVPAGNLIIKDENIFLEVFFNMKNTGKSPTVFAWPEKDTIPNAIGKPFDEWQKPANCLREPRPEGEIKSIQGFALFPDQTFRLRDTIIIDRKKMIPTNSKGHPSASPAIVGCVRYKFISDYTWHQTGFAYLMGKYAPGGVFSSAVIIPLDEGDINLDSLRFIQSAMGGGRFFNAN
jgi:hypothetical protein